MSQKVLRKDLPKEIQDAIKAEYPKGGHPPYIITKEQLGIVYECAKSLTIAQIGAKFGLSEKTMQRIINRQPEVMTVYRCGKVDGILEVSNAFYKAAASSTDPNSSYRWLKCRGEEAWRNVDNVKDDENDAIIDEIPLPDIEIDE
jgi:hypothetical protein